MIILKCEPKGNFWKYTQSNSNVVELVPMKEEDFKPVRVNGKCLGCGFGWDLCVCDHEKVEGQDFHKVMVDKLNILAKKIHELESK